MISFPLLALCSYPRTHISLILDILDLLSMIFTISLLIFQLIFLDISLTVSSNSSELVKCI